MRLSHARRKGLLMGGRGGARVTGRVKAVADTVHVVERGLRRGGWCVLGYGLELQALLPCRRSPRQSEPQHCAVVVAGRGLAAVGDAGVWVESGL